MPRHVCDACGAVHYRNPRIIVGAIPIWEERVLLCRRAIEPRHGKWTLPAGFMEIDETVGQGAARESMEEANARLELHGLYTVISVPQANQVHMFYRARLLDLDFSPGEESLETSLFTEEDIPWEDIAFRTVALTLRHFFADRRAGRFCFHAGEILPQG